jgi:hypothetical protein
VRPVFIYDLSDPRTGHVRYVGKSVRPKERLATHIREARNGSVVHSKRWIAGLLQEGLRPVLSILEVADAAAANDAERFWIASLKLAGADLTNLTPGGDGQMPGYQWSEEARRRLSATSKGRKLSDQHYEHMKSAFNEPALRQRRREIMLVRMADPALRAVAQRGMSGKKMSEDAKRKISASWTEERKQAHAAEKSALPFDDRWRQQLRDALAARWARYREAKNAG